ncbi:DinB family protein [Ktedonosporobacter rubrisoli]|uniref:DinB family protein n=1 Tax=Ktedonosporobacter rubrisoli TaxID=2509675 RepID=A0A4P6JNY0_KTERU|nr:DinB family protein [Ktedonosporobacter rubrisoli]QBD76446.1 DinB family protein [Ktedonosporobacter rubrisoli]
MATNKRSQLLATFAQTPTTLTRLTASLEDKILDSRSAPDEWSIREILAHLVDDEMFVMRTRLERMIKEDSPHLVSNDEKRWYSQRNTARDGINELLQDFAIQRTASQNILTFLREEEWSREAYHPEIGQITVEALLTYWVEHDLVHIQQIEHNLAGAR